MGTKGKRFYKVVAANQRDPRDGKHMEVLGTYVPIPASSPATSELRLRFSRVKFWLGVGASFPVSVGRLLGSAGLIPSPPPLYGWRCRGRYHELLQQQQQQQQMLRADPQISAVVAATAAGGLGFDPVKVVASLKGSLTELNFKASCCGEGRLHLINEVAMWLKRLQQELQQELQQRLRLVQQQLLIKRLKCRRAVALHRCGGTHTGCSEGFIFQVQIVHGTLRVRWFFFCCR
ncbi:hypothetical protein Emag_003240 [Eimeria magna]